MKYRFVCKTCVHRAFSPQPHLTCPTCRDPDVSIVRARHDVSTSNLLNHVKSCEGRRDPGQGTISNFAYGSTYSKELLRTYVALWSATSYRPFTIVEDPYFVKIISMFNPNASLPSDSTVSNDVRDFFQIGRKNLKAYIAVSTYISTVCLDAKPL